VKKNGTLLGSPRTTVSKVRLAYTNHGKKISAKRNNGRKSTLTETDGRILRRIVSTNHRTTAAQVRVELKIYSRCTRTSLGNEIFHDCGFLECDDV
jgi:hypothetical protein